MVFWDRIAGLYDIAQSLNGKVRREMVRLAADLIPEGATVLDTASGTGDLALAVAEKAAEVICTDMSVPMLDKAKIKAEKRGLTNIRFEARNIFDLVDEDETYDVVMAGNVLHLLDDPESAVRELARVTKKGGMMILPTFMLGNRRSRLVEIYKLFGFDPSTNYTAPRYRSMLESCGVGPVRARLIKGIIPCCFAVI